MEVWEGEPSTRKRRCGRLCPVSGICSVWENSVKRLPEVCKAQKGAWGQGRAFTASARSWGIAVAEEAAE